MERVGALTGRVAGRQTSRDWRDWAGLAARLILGIGLFVAGALKVGRLDQNVTQVALYQIPMPDWAVTVIGYAQPFVEMAVGALLIIGLFTRVAAVLGTVAMAVFIFGIVWAWSHGLQIDCGCFSIGGELPEGAETKYVQDILRDLGFIVCGVWLWLRPASALALDTWLLAPLEGDIDYSDLGEDDEVDAMMDAEPSGSGPADDPRVFLPATDEKATR